MILDTTYLLLLARIAIDIDLLGAIAKGKVDLACLTSYHSLAPLSGTSLHPC